MNNSFIKLIQFALIGILTCTYTYSANKKQTEKNPAPTTTIKVNKTFNKSHFTYEMKKIQKKGHVSVYKVKFSSPVKTKFELNNIVPAEFYLPEIPKGEAKRPGVLVLHILGGNFEISRLACNLLSSNGIPAMMIKLPYYGERSIPGGKQQIFNDANLFSQSMTQSIADIRRSLDMLASRDEINPDRVGIMGISMGAIIGASAAAQDSRVYRTALILGGGNLLKIIEHPRETRGMRKSLASMSDKTRKQIEKNIKQIDPLTHAKKLRKRALSGKVMMVNAGNDEVILKDRTLELAKALGIENKIQWLKGYGHYTTIALMPELMKKSVDFFSIDMPKDATIKKESTPTGAGKPTMAFLTVLKKVSSFIDSPPGKGKAHFLNGTIEINPKNKDKAIRATFKFARGYGNKFILECNLPIVGNLSIGENQFPWMKSKNNKVFLGKKDQVENGNPVIYVSPNHLLSIQMGSGLLATAMMMPEMADKYVIIKEEKIDNKKVLDVTIKRKFGGKVKITFKEDNQTPDNAIFNIKGISGKITFKQFFTNTPVPDSLFEPEGVKETEMVSERDIYGIWGETFNFITEKHLR